jgi:endonuclease-3
MPQYQLKSRKPPVGKRPFDIDLAFQRLRKAGSPFRPAALFALADQGYDSPFEVLVACIVSIRTRDETTVPAARRLFEVARTPSAIGQLSIRQIDDCIHSCTFHRAKAR